MNDATAETGTVTNSAAGKSKFRPLRAWPAVVLLLALALARFVPGLLEGGRSKYWMVANFVLGLCGILLLIWWATASRAGWRERVLGLLGVIAALAVTVVLADPSMRGFGTVYLTLPMGMFLFGAGAAALAARRPSFRTGAAVFLAFLGMSYSILLRGEGYTGDYVMESDWRWAESREAKVLARSGTPVAAEPSGDTSHPAGSPTATNMSSTAQAPAAAFADPEWPAFRGADRSGRVRGPQIATNWATQAPRQVWKVPVGPGWSSFAVAGQRLFTQEQRGPMEAVVCYDANTGRELWKIEVEARLEDPMGGPGPRATPTLALLDTPGKAGAAAATNQPALFAMGSTGILLRADPLSGRKIWQANVKEIAGREKLPMWGFAASPLVTRGLVIVYGGGPGDKGWLAFDAENGTLRWSIGGAGIESYSSAQLNTFGGEEVALLVSEAGLLAVDPLSGKERLNYPLPIRGYRAQQPAVVGDTVIFYSSMAPGTRAIRITKANGQLAAEELWTARNLKPDFTDFVVFDGHLYGIDGGFLVCVDAKTGERKWRDGRYGKGEAVLLENSAALLIAAEDGRAVLVSANPAEHANSAISKLSKARLGITRSSSGIACIFVTLRKRRATSCPSSVTLSWLRSK